MKKFIIARWVMSAILITCLGVVTIFAQDENNSDGGFSKFKGNVSEATLKLFSDGTKKNVAYKFIFTYNRKGLLTQMSKYTSGGKDPTTIDKYKYNVQDKVIEKGVFTAKGQLLSKTIYKYDAAGHLTNNSTYNSDGALRAKEVSVFDDKGARINYTSYDKNDNILTKETATYNDLGILVMKTTVNEPALGVSKDEFIGFQYDTNEALIKEIHYSIGNPDEIKYTTNYIYNEKGKLTEKSVANYTKTVYQYDAQGTIIAEDEVELKNGNTITSTVYKYDVKGNLIAKENKLANEVGPPYTDAYKYKYDTKGNQVEGAYYIYESKFGEFVETLQGVSTTAFKYY